MCGIATPSSIANARDYGSRLKAGTTKGQLRSHHLMLAQIPRMIEAVGLQIGAVCRYFRQRGLGQVSAVTSSTA